MPVLNSPPAGYRSVTVFRHAPLCVPRSRQGSDTPSDTAPRERPMPKLVLAYSGGLDTTTAIK
ncbi:MAG: hypothetical protein KC470_13485, partial [Dehalococcoidia bacterium]|nr:hypothetical protein [Dehalococcoidia bacterium]